MSDGAPGTVGGSSALELRTRRARQLYLVGTAVWLAFASIDPLRADGNLVTLIAIRLLALLLTVPVLLYLRGRREASPGVLTILENAAPLYVSGLLGVLAAKTHGVASISIFGIPLVTAAFGITVSVPWRRALLISAIGMALYCVALALVTASGHGVPVTAAKLTFFFQLLAEAVLFSLAIIVLLHRAWATKAELDKVRRLGRYRLQARLGRGGMGDVWLAHDDDSDRELALKILRTDGSAAAIARFRREAQAMARVNSRHFPRIFDHAQTDDGIWYLAMEVIEGKTFRELAQGSGPIPIKRAVELVRQAANGLAEAHAAGVIHRDVKPDNLIVSDNGDRELVKVIDLGLAGLDKHDDAMSLTVEGGLLGTPQYMSPEQADGRPADARSDVYSLGATLYFLVAGRPPFLQTTVHALAAAHALDPPPLLSSVVADAPPRLEALLARCLAKDPAERFPSMTSLVQALGEIEG